MAKLNELELKPIKTVDNSNMYVAIVFTLSDDFLDDLTEKKVSRAWNTFSRKYGKDNPKKEYFVSTDASALNDDDTFIDKDTVVITGINSLMGIEEKDKENFDFGFRVLKDNKLIMIDETITKDLEKNELNRGLTFDEVEQQYLALNDYLLKRVEEKKIRDEHLEKENQIEKENVSEEFSTQSNTEGVATDIQKELDELNADEETFLKNDEQRQHETYEQDRKEVETDNFNERYDITSKDDNESKIEEYKKALYQYIERQIPLPNLDSIDVANILSRIDYKGYKDLYEITQNSIEKKINYNQAVLEKERKELIANIYRTMEKELVKRHGNNEKLTNYTDVNNEFSHIYNAVMKDYREAIDSLEHHKNQKELVLTEQFNLSKKEYIQRIVKEHEEEFDRINKPKIKESVTKYVDEIKNSIEENKETQIVQLEDDIFVEVTNRNELLTEEVINDFTPSINNAIQEFGDKISLFMNNVGGKIEVEIGTLIDKIQDIEKKRIEAEKLSSELIDAKVAQKTVDYDSMRDKITSLESEIYNKNKAIRDIEAELMKKDNIIVSSEEARKALNADKEYHKKVADELKMEVRGLQEKQLETMREFNSHPENNVRLTTIENKKNRGEKLTFSERLDSIDKKIYNLIGATLIGASLLGSAFVIGGNDGSDNSGEIKALEQKVEEQQKKLEESKSVEEARQKEELEKAKAEQEKSVEEARQKEENKKSKKD